MSTNTALKMLFACILLSLLIYTSWAGFTQPVWAWGGLTSGTDRYWTIATLMDAYFGFLTFYVWVFYKETRWSRRISWFIAIMVLGNMAMSSYVLLQLFRLQPGQPAADMLLARNAKPNVQSRQGVTALMVASRAGYTDLVRALLARLQALPLVPGPELVGLWQCQLAPLHIRLYW